MKFFWTSKSWVSCSWVEPFDVDVLSTLKMRKIADVWCEFMENLHYKPWNILGPSKYWANGLSESKISNGSDVRFVRDSHLKIRCFVNFDAILRKICIINLEIFLIIKIFGQWTIWIQNLKWIGCWVCPGNPFENSMFCQILGQWTI